MHPRARRPCGLARCGLSWGHDRPARLLQPLGTATHALPRTTANPGIGIQRIPESGFVESRFRDHTWPSSSGTVGTTGSESNDGGRPKLPRGVVAMPTATRSPRDNKRLTVQRATAKLTFACMANPRAVEGPALAASRSARETSPVGRPGFCGTSLQAGANAVAAGAHRAVGLPRSMCSTRPESSAPNGCRIGVIVGRAPLFR